MKKYKWVIIVNLIVVLIFFNLSVVKKEKILSDGKLILLELAPVDPRSLMQGDYMDLRYAIGDDVKYVKNLKRGFLVVELQENGVAERRRIQEKVTKLNKNEYLIEFNTRDWSGIQIGAESFFFQEGDAEKYEKAKYGGLKVDNKGNSVLIGLYDVNLKEIK